MGEQGGSKDTITLKSSDNVTFEVEFFIAKQMQTVQSFIDDGNSAATSTIIPLPNVCSTELIKIIDYCSMHYRNDDVGDGDEFKEFDRQFLATMNYDELKALFAASNYLNIKDLFNFLSQSIANIIENKSVEFVRNFFGIENDYTLEEEAALREENAWAFEVENRRFSGLSYSQLACMDLSLDLNV
ncbi:hypothetical protein VNO77_27779 [Canavalia gladiata]|uniref:SKP1-like protein n=1 Tax=Canavalia gladiata TaxID=3824 RepID=A0AAN9KYG4_CANGL